MECFVLLPLPSCKKMHLCFTHVQTHSLFLCVSSWPLINSHTCHVSFFVLVKQAQHNLWEMKWWSVIHPTKKPGWKIIPPTQIHNSIKNYNFRYKHSKNTYFRYRYWIYYLRCFDVSVKWHYEARTGSGTACQPNQDITVWWTFFQRFLKRYLVNSFPPRVNSHEANLVVNMYRDYK